MISDIVNQVRLLRGDALLAIDIQNDFMPGGNLAVPNGDKVVPVMNAYIEKFHIQKLPIYASRDWHPGNHHSFVTQGGPWPQHCVADSSGAEFHPDLSLPENVIVVSKGTEADDLSYSVFSNPEFQIQLQNNHIQRLFIGGLATDYCVLNAVIAALDSGFEVYLLLDAVRAVNVNSSDGSKAIETMTNKGAIPITLKVIQ